jgi:protein gp37
VSWVLVSGEGGPEARPCDIAWIRSLIEQGKAAGVPIFVKQLGTATNVYGATHETGHAPTDTRTRRASDMDEWPEAIRVREMPDAA